MRKSIVLYKNGKYKYVKEEKLKNLISTKLDKIKLILIPYLESTEYVYIPCKPVKELLFDSAEIQFVTSIFTISIEVDDDAVNHMIGNRCKTSSIYEFINYIYYAAKVIGNLNWQYENLDYGPEVYVNLMTITGLYIRLFDKYGKNIYEYKKMECDYELDDNGRLEFCDFYTEMIEIIYDLKGIWHFIPILGQAEIKLKHSPASIILGDEYYIESTQVIDSKRDYLYLMNNFNAFILTSGENLEKLLNAPKLECRFYSIIQSKWDKEQIENFKYMLERSDMRDFDYYEEYIFGLVSLSSMLELIIYQKELLSYFIYVFYMAVMESRGEVDEMHGIMTISIERPYHTSDVEEIIFDGYWKKSKELFHKIINLKY